MLLGKIVPDHFFWQADVVALRAKPSAAVDATRTDADQLEQQLRRQLSERDRQLAKSQSEQAAHATRVGELEAQV